MISWRVLRGICALLLAIPLVHVTYLIAQDTLSSMNGSPSAWAEEIDAYEQRDHLAKLPHKPIVVVGGRRVTLWTGLEDVLPQLVLMRGIGQATVDDILHNYKRLIGFYRPDTLIFIPGNNEFHIRAQKSAQELVAGIKELVALDRKHMTTRRVYIIAPLKIPMYSEDFSKIEKTIALLQGWAETKPRVVILDANPLISDADGQPRAHYYRPDGVSLNEHGYLRLSVMLQTAIEEDPLAPNPNNS